jgi:photosystem II stability/assembly factor-like uncharacterized protein
MLEKLKSIFILISLVSSGFISVYAQGSWEVVEVPTYQHLRSVYFTDSLYGWAVGDTGTIIHTKDGGENWFIQDAGTSNNIVNVFFLNRQLGWASSWNFSGFFGTLILKTIDGGNTWTSEPYQEDNIFMNCILFQDSLTGWMGGSPHAIVKTNNGGQTWTQAAIDTNALAFFPVLNIFFYDQNYGYACGGMFDIAGVTWSTSNGGEKWYPIDNTDAPADEIHGLHLFDSTNVIGAGGDPDLGYGVGMLRTDDGGINWDYEELSMAGNAYDLDFRNESEVWAPLGPAQMMIYSLDAAMSWIQTPTPESTSIFDMIFPDTTHGYAVGYNGAFIKYIPKPVGVAEYDNMGFDISLNIYPNPASRVITLEFIIPEGEKRGRGELTIIDSFGREVLEITISDSPAGKNSVDVKVDELPAGPYICRLTLNTMDKSRIASQILILR